MSSVMPPNVSKLQGRKTGVALINRLADAEKQIAALRKEVAERPETLDVNGIAELQHSIDALGKSRQNMEPLVEAVVEAISHLDFKVEQKDVDVAPIVEVLKELKLDPSPIASAIATLDTEVNLSGVRADLQAIRRELAKANDATKELIKAVRAPRTVSYDSDGRITEIRTRR